MTGSEPPFVRPKRPRGAIPTTPAKIAASPQHTPTATPAFFIAVPLELSYWGNDVDGDCVTAEEAFAKAASYVYAGLNSSQEIFFSYDAMVQWASNHGYLNGANLTDVMDTMAQAGMSASNGITYTDGPYQSVDFSTDATLRSAIAQGPVKLGVAGDQLDNVVGASNGWVATKFSQDANEDHCVSLCGFGTIAQLCAALNVSVPSGVDGTQPGYALFTWNTVGVIDRPSMLAITWEAWLRTPTTPQQLPVPTPTPTPVPTPIPTPTPVPTPVPTPTPTPVPVSTDQTMLINFTQNTITTSNIKFQHTWDPKGTGTITVHEALGTMTLPQKDILNGISFPN